MRRQLLGLVVTIVTASAPLSARAAAKDGAFSIRGAGLLSCAYYVQERAKRSSAYYMIGGWIDGYITAINQYVPDTYDVTSFESTELFTEMIQNHCADNPEHRLFSVMNTLVMRIKDDRLRSGSPFVKVEIGERRADVYRETLRRAQDELRRRGFYSGDSSGDFNDKTREGIASFQKSIDFVGTGFPDQTTLWRLLRREPETKDAPSKQPDARDSR